MESIGYISNAANANKPNANGYDVYDRGNKIVAELKGMLPCLKNGNFGSQQKVQIIKDVDGLFNGKNSEQCIQGFNKYIVLLEKDININNAKTKTAMGDLIKGTQYKMNNNKTAITHNQDNIQVIYLDGKTEIKQEHKNIVFSKF